MTFKVSSNNQEILHKLEFLFFNQIEDDIELIFEHPDEYVVEYDDEGGVLGLVLRMTINPIPEWQLVNTRTSSKRQCLNRIAMVHLMCFFSSRADFSNFQITFDDDIRCVCGADSVKTTHSSWCDKYE